MKNKARRQKTIAKLIADKPVETQEALVTALKKAGYEVTQATLSRDLKELGVSKVRNDEGKLIYAIGTAAVGDTGWPALSRMAETFVGEVNAAVNLVVVKTSPGYASGVAAAIDNLKQAGVVGSVAGDDTILVVMSDEAAARIFADRLAKGA